MTGGPLLLLRLLQRIFAAQARDAARRVTVDGPEYDPLPWMRAAADAVRPVVLEMYQRGMLRSAARQARASEGGRDGFRSYAPGNDAIFGERKGVMFFGRPTATGTVACSQVTTPAGAMVRGESPRHGPGTSCHRGVLLQSSKHPGRLVQLLKRAGVVQTGFDLYNPRVLDAVDQLTLQFCRDTNDTATRDLEEARRALRRLLRAGLARGDAVRLLARRVRRIFADPARAYRIAATESSRAAYAGQLWQSRESGVVRGKLWVANAGACPQCQELDGVERGLDEPFVTVGIGPYARVMHPPLHPHCGCDMQEVL